MGSDIMDIGMPAPPLVAIGASTGGPKALATILKDLPESFPGAVVIVQHLDHHFCQGLAEWLDHGTALSVSALNEDVVPQAGHVYVAARPEHVVLQRDRTLGFSQAEPERLNRPSVDVLFHSIARVLKSQAIGVLLTGMGRDGAEGLLAMRQAGLTTIAQDAASSVVYGMPKAARDLGAAQSILPLGTIGQELMYALECL
jgi:two-component system response regulator WspF